MDLGGYILHNVRFDTSIFALCYSESKISQLWEEKHVKFDVIE